MTPGLSSVGQMHNGFANPGRFDLLLGIDHGNSVETTRADLFSLQCAEIDRLPQHFFASTAMSPPCIVCCKHHQTGGNAGGCWRVAEQSGPWPIRGGIPEE
jgi:hypothetical protein